MKRISTLLLLSACLWLLAGCTAPESDPGTEARYVTFQGRQIDLQPYVEGFPYSGFQPFYEAGKLYYYHQDSTTLLKAIDLDGSADLAQGEVISDIDFATRNVWGIRYRSTDRRLYWIGDEVNDEVINLYRLDPATRAIEKLTEVPYIFGWRWDSGKTNVAYVARLGDKEDRLGELRLLNLETGKETVIMQDNPQFRFTWSDPSWQPNGKGVVTGVLKDADRTYGNLVYIDLAKQTWKLLTDPTKPRSYPYADKHWLSDTEFIYYSNEDGFNNAYKYNLTTGSSQQLTHFQRDLEEHEMVTVDEKRYLFTVIGNPIENEILLVDPENGAIVHQEKTALNVSILDGAEDRLLVSTTSASSMFRIDEMTLSPEQFASSVKIDMPESLKKQIVHARVERLEYPTFDIDPATGAPRMLHAFLYHPEKPLPKGQQMVMIQSFYGGGNYFSKTTQILAEAGIYVLSPSPRGSSGFGREFSALNDKDLGGNEIIDIIYAGKYISEKLGIPPSHIGVYGGSHGGYATMRLLTFPGEINGNTASFDWGFGISHAGFSDIIHFYEHCNIPDWVTLEAGDPQTEAAKLRDRSPLYHADQMTGKLLLTHGTNDSRVPIAGSRMMADSLRKYHKDVTLVEFEGQGHGIKGLANTVRNYQVWFGFLETVE